MFDLKYFIVLLLLQVEKFRISHSLVKVLEWKFKIIETQGVIKSLERENLILSHKQDPFSLYEITSDGTAYLQNNWEVGIAKIYKEYPTEAEFITALVSNVNSKKQ